MFTGGGTEADNLAVKGAAHARLEAGVDAVVTTAIEHKGVLAAAQRLETDGFRVTRVGRGPGRDRGSRPAGAMPWTSTPRWSP